MATSIATDSCLFNNCFLAGNQPPLQPMVANQNESFAKRLNAVLDEDQIRWPRHGRRIRLAKAFGVSGESARKWLSGESLPKLSTASDIASELGINVNWLMNGQGPKHPTAATISATTAPPAASARVAFEPPPGSRVGVWETLDDLPPGKYLAVPLYEVELSAGDGCVWCEHAEDEPIVFRARYFQAIRSKPENCRALYVRGDSMAPTVGDGDAVMVDITRTAIRDDTIYAVMYHGELFIKRVFRIPGGGIELRSDNARYKSINIEGDGLHKLTILGAVVWRSGTPV